MLKRLAELVGFLALAVFTSFVILTIVNHKSAIFTLPILPKDAVPQPVLADELNVVTQDSPDGKMTIAMNKLSTKDQTTDSFYIGNKLLLSKIFGPSGHMSIPVNTWSPDDAYVFLKEDDKNVSSYYLFKADGETFVNKVPYIDMSNLFTNRYPQYMLTEVTGWAAPNLLIINTMGQDGQIGPSFWFDVPSQSFIQLATHFW